MSLFEAILLGFIQGATEFLPVSSSGHLALGHALLGMNEPELLFDIVLHVGTLLAIIGYYRRDVLGVVTGSFKGLSDYSKSKKVEDLLAPEGMRLAILVGLATIPTGIIGVLLGKILDPEVGPSLIGPAGVCGFLILNGFVLIGNVWIKREPAQREQPLLNIWNLGLAAALIVGVTQGLAVLPGISRSGMTITTALLLGVSRPDAARFSFLLSIPAILGAVVLKFDTSLFTGDQGMDMIILHLVGASVAAIVGLVCLIWLVRLLKNARFHHFAWYCWLVGIAGSIYFWQLG